MLVRTGTAPINTTRQSVNTRDAFVNTCIDTTPCIDKTVVRKNDHFVKRRRVLTSTTRVLTEHDLSIHVLTEHSLSIHVLTGHSVSIHVLTESSLSIQIVDRRRRCRQDPNGISGATWGFVEGYVLSGGPCVVNRSM